MTFPHQQPRRLALQTGLALSLGALLPAASACEFFSPHLRITHPWSRATRPGDSQAIVAMRFDEVTQADRLIGVETPLARAAELHGLPGSPKVDLAIPAGRETLLGESGITLRLVGLRQMLELGRSYPLKLIFAHGGSVQAALEIDFEAA
jgi:copper(I)-binding protein